MIPYIWNIRVVIFRVIIYSWTWITHEIFFMVHELWPLTHPDENAAGVRKWQRDCYLRLKLSRLSSISEVADSEVLLYERESGNVTDRYTVAVKKEKMIIGHLTRRCCVFAHFSWGEGEPFVVLWLELQPASIDIDLHVWKCTDCNKIIHVKIILCIKIFVVYDNHNIFFYNENFQIYSNKVMILHL